LGITTLTAFATTPPHTNQTAITPSSTVATTTPTPTTPTAQPSTPQATASTTASNPAKSYGKYVASVCTKQTILRQHVQENDSNLMVGDSFISEGYDGYTETCTADSYGLGQHTNTYPAGNIVTHVGTRVPYSAPAVTPAVTSPTNSISYQQAQANCSALGTSDSSAWQQCLHAYGY
jgi:hypothetical protein